MKVLVTCAKIDFKRRLPIAVLSLKQFYADKPDVTVVSAAQVPWDEVRATVGGWDGLGPWTAQNFDAAILLETEKGGLGNGTHKIAEAMLSAGKPLAVFREGRPIRVKSVTPTCEADWKSYFSVVEV